MDAVLFGSPNNPNVAKERWRFGSAGVNPCSEGRTSPQRSRESRISLSFELRRSGKHTSKEGSKVFFVRREALIAFLTHWYRGQIRRIRPAKQTFRRDVIAVRVEVRNPLSAVDAPALLTLVDELWDLLDTQYCKASRMDPLAGSRWRRARARRCPR